MVEGILAGSLAVNAALWLLLIRRRPDPDIKGLTSIGLRLLEDREEREEREQTDYDRVLHLVEDAKKINWSRVDPLQAEELIELIITLTQNYEE